MIHVLRSGNGVAVGVGVGVAVDVGGGISVAVGADGSGVFVTVGVSVAVGVIGVTVGNGVGDNVAVGVGFNGSIISFRIYPSSIRVDAGRVSTRYQSVSGTGRITHTVSPWSTTTTSGALVDGAARTIALGTVTRQSSQSGTGVNVGISVGVGIASVARRTAVEVPCDAAWAVASTTPRPPVRM